MINTTEVITLARQGNYPSNWKVYRGQGNYGCANVGKFLAICFLIALIAVLLIGIDKLYLSEYSVLVFLGIPFMICAWVAQKSKVNADARSNSTLVLLPEGAVQCLAGNVNNPAWLFYPNIKRIELVQKTEVNGNEDGISTYYYYWLDVYGNDSNYFQFRVWDGFGNAEFLSKTIIAAYNHYWDEY